MKRARLWTVAVWAAVFLAGCGTSRKGQLERVAKDWCQTIRASQVIPVYPLTEDIQPGDVFLVDLDVTRQHQQYEDKGFLPLDNHLARLEQVDYAKFYSDSFDPGAPLPKVWLEQQTPYATKAPRAAFPSYTFTTTRSGGLNLAVPVSGVPVGLSFLGAKSATGSVTISDARTYGLGIVALAERIGNWSDENREFLAQYASRDGEPRYLRVVSRVYLTGGVDITLQDSRSAGGDVSAGVARPVELLTAKTSDRTETASADAYKANIDALNEMVAASEGAEGVGGRVKVASASARSITLKETFPRPLVIGYLGFDMKILEGGMLGPPAPSLAVIADRRLPGDGSFFSGLDQKYLAAKEKARGMSNDQRSGILAALGIATSEDVTYTRFSRELARWLNGQGDTTSAKRRVIGAIDAASREG